MLESKTARACAWASSAAGSKTLKRDTKPVLKPDTWTRSTLARKKHER